MKKTGNIWLPDNDIFFTNRQEYELNDFKIAMQHPTRFCTAIDIGAHVGFWSRRLAGKFQTVLSFEPVLDHFECLTKNTEHLKNIRTFNIALSDNNTQLYMTQTYENSGMSSVVDNKTELSVQAQTLDSFNLENVDFIKIDVEGHEQAVIDGAIETLTRCRPVLFIEVLHYNKKSSNIFETIRNLGYCQAARVEENYIFVFTQE